MRFSGKLLIGPLLLGLAAAPACAAPGKWVRIFDGKSLDGWTPKITGHPPGYNYRDTFRAEGGKLRVAYDGYDKFDKRFGHIAWKRAVQGPFRVRFQYRFYGQTLPGTENWQHSNSGLMFLAQAPETMRRDQEFPVSMEMQLLGTPRPVREPTGNLCTPGTHVVMKGKLETTHCILSSSPVYANGRWMRAEVEVNRDGRVTHFIEGKPVLRYSAPQYDPVDPDAKPLIAAAGGKLAVTGGYLYLQSEGHPVEFRIIELMELD